jgi:ketosteroid isomerase-like protein
MSKENVDVVRAMFAAYLRGDDQALTTFAHAGVEMQPSWDSTEVTPQRGHDAFLRFWRGWESAWEDYFIEVRELHDAGDEVVVVLYERGRGPGSGIVVEDLFAHVWAVDGGKVSRVEAFSHRRDALAAAGIRCGDQG